VLIILHQEHSTPGHVGSLLLASGHSLDIRRPRYGEPLPQTLEGHAGTVIFGGPMSANDSDDYLRAEIALIELALKEQSPFLGICLGAQMMAICLGAEVKTDPDGHVEIGYHDVEPLDTANLGGPWPRRFYQWHREGFALPAGSVPLATARGRFPNQALKYGPTAIGLQFHPEITYAMAARWSGRNDHRLHLLPGAMPREAQLAEHIAQGPVVRDWLARFLEDWLASPSARSIAAAAAPAASGPRS
jgi:GMP synthase (glutamine-hydrolysing)